MEELINCPKCKAPNTPDKWVCDFCGARTTAGFQGDQRRKEEERLRKIADAEAAIRAEEAKKVELAKQAVLDAEAEEARAEEELKLQQQATEEKQRRKLHRQDHDEFYQHWKSGRLSAEEALNGMYTLQTNSPKYPLFSWDARRIHSQKVAVWKAIKQAKRNQASQQSQTTSTPISTLTPTITPDPVPTSTPTDRYVSLFGDLVGIGVCIALVIVVVVNLAPNILSSIIPKQGTTLTAQVKAIAAGRDLSRPSTRLTGRWIGPEGTTYFVPLSNTDSMQGNMVIKSGSEQVNSTYEVLKEDKSEGGHEVQLKILVGNQVRRIFVSQDGTKFGPELDQMDHSYADNSLP